jgi:EmrB/QacA subfamily drug resistance transporter
MSRQWKVLAVVSAAVFMASLDLFIVNVAFPDIQRDFAGSDVASLSWVLNAYAIVYAALLVPAGRLADRVGRKRLFLTGLLVFTAASVLCAAAPSLGVLIAARILQAAGAAFLTPTSLALLLPEFPPERRPVAIGAWSAVGGIAAAFGPPLGGVLVEASWRWVFLINVPIALAATVAGVRILRESEPERGPWPDLLGAVLLAGSIALLALGLVKGSAWGWGSDRVVGAFAASAVLGAAFAWRTTRHPVPVIHPELLRVRSFTVATLASGLFFAAFAVMLLGGVLFRVDVWHDSILTAGLELAPGPVMAAIFAVPAARLGTRFGHARTAAVGGVLFALGSLFWAWQLTAAPHYAADLLPGMLLTGTGVGFVLSNLAAAATSGLPPARFATGSAIFTMGRQIGSVLGVAIFVALVGAPTAAGAVHAFDKAWLFMAGASLAAALTATFAEPARRRSAQTVPAAEGSPA